MAGWAKAWVELRGIVANELLFLAFRVMDRRDRYYRTLALSLQSYFKSIGAVK